MPVIDGVEIHNSTTAALAYPLNCRILAMWPQWRGADDWGRRQLKERQLTPGEANALERLARNLKQAGDPATWFHLPSARAAEEELLPGVLETVLRGLTVAPNAVEEFGRALRISGTFRRQTFLNAVRQRVECGTWVEDAAEPDFIPQVTVEQAPSLVTVTNEAGSLTTVTSEDPRLGSLITAISETGSLGKSASEASAPDVFSPEHPCQRDPLEVTAMSPVAATLNGHPKPVASLITPPKAAGIAEMVEAAIGRMKLNLAEPLTPAQRKEIAQRAGVEERQVTDAIRRIRERRGIVLRNLPSRGRNTTPTTPAAKPSSHGAKVASAEPPQAPEPMRSAHVTQARAQGLALTLAEELVSVSREAGDDRAALLLKASSLLEKVL